jgi:hypothetical protein
MNSSCPLKKKNSTNPCCINKKTTDGVVLENENVAGIDEAPAKHGDVVEVPTVTKVFADEDSTHGDEMKKKTCSGVLLDETKQENRKRAHEDEKELGDVSHDVNAATKKKCNVAMVCEEVKEESTYEGDKNSYKNEDKSDDGGYWYPFMYYHAWPPIPSHLSSNLSMNQRLILMEQERELERQENVYYEWKLWEDAVFDEEELIDEGCYERHLTRES